MEQIDLVYLRLLISICSRLLLFCWEKMIQLEKNLTLPEIE